MPRRRRPSPVRLPTRPLAPRPALNRPEVSRSIDIASSSDTDSIQQATEGLHTQTSACGVPQCTIPNCKLSSHLNYSRRRRTLPVKNKHVQDLVSPESSPESLPHTEVEPEMDTDLVLPIEVDAEGSFHRLFRQFFEDHFDQLVFIYRPPRKDPALKQATYRLALRDPIYCLTLIAQAHMANIRDQPANLSHFADEQTERIYSRLLQRTREKLEAFDVSDVDVLLLAIVALCEYDLQLGRHDALRSHHIGMTALVAKRGGPHNLGLSLPYVLRMDRFLAVRANQMPNFAPTELPTSDIVIRDAVRASGRGSYFVKDISGLSESTIVLCSDAAHLLDLTDELGIALKSASTTQSQSPKLEYYYFLRENIDARHAVLNSSSYENLATSPNEMLALTATKIVTYFVTSANYLPVVTDLLATRLWSILENASGSLSPASTMQNLDLEEGKTPRALSIKIAHWEEDTPMLLWLLFACALPSSSRERNMSFTAHLAMSEELRPASTAALSKSSHRQGAPPLESSGGRSIVSPSSPRRRRLLPNFILYVAEKLVGERPLSGTGEWDKEVVAILESFVWHGKRLEVEYTQIVAQVHNCVLVRATHDV